MKRFKKKKVINKYLIIFVLIILLALKLYSTYLSKMNDNVFNIVKVKIDNINTMLLNNLLTDFSDKDLNNLLTIKRGAVNEINTIDYNVSAANKLLSEYTDKLEKQIVLLETGNYDDLNYKDDLITSINNNFIIYIPFNTVYNSFFITSTGPDIPIKVRLNGSITSKIKSKITEYGINNSLLEVYLSFDIKENVYVPSIKKDITRNYDLLICSKLIKGKVPTLYNGSYIYDKNE